MKYVGGFTLTKDEAFEIITFVSQKSIRQIRATVKDNEKLASTLL